MTQIKTAVPVGVAMEISGASGWTTCIFDADAVPVGSTLYAHPKPGWLEALQHHIQYRDLTRTHDWRTMAIFDSKTVAERYLAFLRQDTEFREYRLLLFVTGDAK